MVTRIVDDKILETLLGLTPEQRFSLARILLDSLAGESEEAITEEEKTMIERRITECREHPEQLIPWEEAKVILSKQPK